MDLKLISLVLSISVCRGCPDGFLTHAQSCYMAFNVRATWAEASIICEAYGGHLAVIGDAHEQHFLQSYVGRNIGGFYPGIFWLGADDIQIDGEWKWQGKKLLTNNDYQNWAPHQPDNLKNDEHCMAMRFVDGFTWSDMSCAQRLDFICEIPSGNPAVIPGIIG